MSQLAVQDLQAHCAVARALLLDVREPWEVEVAALSLPGVAHKHIPLGQVPDRLDELDVDTAESAESALEYLNDHRPERQRRDAATIPACRHARPPWRSTRTLSPTMLDRLLARTSPGMASSRR